MSLSACDLSSLDLRDSDGLRREEAAVGGWMVVEDSVEPGRLVSMVLLLLGPAAVVSSSESSSQPTSSSAEAAGRKMNVSSVLEAMT